jgi:hypothetical protein
MGDEGTERAGRGALSDGSSRGTPAAAVRGYRRTARSAAVMVSGGVGRCIRNP